MQFFIVFISNLIISIFAAPTINYIQHEKRDRIPQGWAVHQKLSKNALLPMRIALTQQNLDKAEDFLIEVSHPRSEKYGQHWSAKEIAETFAPSRKSVDIVIAWLGSAGVAPENIFRSRSLGWLDFDATVDQAESLLKTSYHIYKHSTGGSHVACLEYYIPEHVRAHLDFIVPTVHFDTKLPRPGIEYERNHERIGPKSAAGVAVVDGTAVDIGSPGSGSLPKKGADVDSNYVLSELSKCDRFTIPSCLRALYKIPLGQTANPENSLGIVEYTPQAFLQDDLDLFFSNFSKNQDQKSPILDQIDGGFAQTVNKTFGNNSESDLDLEYAMALINPQKVTLYQVGDLISRASFNNFLDALDGSYCTFEGGDDSKKDGVYPDKNGGYQGPKDCGKFAATKVISTSYTYNEAELTAKYVMRQCAEYMKLGLAGVTILYSSGDYGVAGNLGTCIDPKTKLFNSNGTFNPSFPGTCPYVTTVGATQIRRDASVNTPEVACETVIYSGGGFSNVFPLPSYQAAAVRSWFKNHPPPYDADRFNNSQLTRGIPDISANGANYVIAVDGNFSFIYGSSAATPVVGAIFTLINEARLNAGKPVVGFVNPFLYENADAFNDITSGRNPGCGTPGFQAVEGWDPLTGLGTPDFEKLLARYLAL